MSELKHMLAGDSSHTPAAEILDGPPAQAHHQVAGSQRTISPAGQEVSGFEERLGFTGCGKTHSGGRPGIHPRQKPIQTMVGFSP
jgi:hypothetical protein